MPDAVVIGEVDPGARREEVGNDQPGDDLHHLNGCLVIDVGLGQRRDERRRHVHHAGQSVDGELAENFTALGREKRRQLIVVRKFTARYHDAARQEIVEIGRILRLGPQLLEEDFELTNSQGLEQHVPATRKEPVDRCPRETGTHDDVVDRDMRQAEIVDAGPRGLEHSNFVVPHR